MRLAHNGTKITLNFADSVGDDVANIASNLRPYVKGITRTPDGKKLVITLADNYRVRQFLSGYTNGIDIITKDKTAATTTKAQTDTALFDATPPKKADAPAILTTKKSNAKTKPSTKTTTETSSKNQKKPQSQKTEQKPSKQPAKNIVTSAKQKAATAPPSQSEGSKKENSKDLSRIIPDAVKAPKEATEKNILTTKAAEPTSPNASKPATEAKNGQPDLPPTPVEKNADSNESIKKEGKPPRKKPYHPKPITNELLVGLVKSAKTPTLEFFLNQRTALAVFTRGEDLWVIFAREMPVNIARIVTILPDSLSHVESFILPGHTVLRFSMTKRLYPEAIHVANSYNWQIKLNKAEQAPQKPIDYLINSATQQQGILFRALDSAKPVSFYDPVYGDKLLIAPIYDNGRAVVTPKSIQGSDILLTGQGIAVRSDDDTMRLDKKRAGILLHNANSLPALQSPPFLPGQAILRPVSSEADKIVIAYHKFFSAAQNFANSRAAIARELAEVDPTERPKKLHELAGIYIAYGFGPETAKILDDIRIQYADYYKENKLAIMHAAALFLTDRLQEASAVLNQSELPPEIEEVALWRDILALYKAESPLKPNIIKKVNKDDLTNSEAATTPPSSETDASAANAPAEEENKALLALLGQSDEPPPLLDLLKYQNNVLRYYPPRIRQKLSIVGADSYIKHKRYTDAVKLFDLLNNDGLLQKIQPFAEYLFGRIAAEKGEVDRALKVWQRLIERDEDPLITARADFSAITLSYTHKRISLEETIQRLEELRFDWRYDNLEETLLQYLGDRYKEAGQYDAALRTWKELVNNYPNSVQALKTTIDMTNLFMKLYNDGWADKLSPLKALALFYEFRHLIPVDMRGDNIVRNLADRLAAVDLNDRAIALLAHQIKFRSEGLDRAQLGTRLALLYLIEKDPAKALETLEATNYGELPSELARVRNQIAARALADVGKPEEGFAALRNDTSLQGIKLRMQIVWQMEDWPNVINLAEDQLALRKDFTAPLNADEQEVLIRLALAYSFENNKEQLKYLQDYYLNLIPNNSSNKPIFYYLTSHNEVLNPKEIDKITAQISGTAAFLKSLRESLQSLPDLNAPVDRSDASKNDNQAAPN